ncbi:isochorismatase family protein [Sneathiella sp.]|uniref:isochorismatase family protein n=1 Tax=Sneathiella sp. TaxID=1964365 RepID=UPI002FE08DAE
MTQNLVENYIGAGFRQKLGYGRKSALLFVDFVAAYFEPSSPLYAPPAVDALASGVRLLEAGRAAGVPVFFTRVVYHKGGHDGGVFYRKIKALSVFDEGSPLGAFAPGMDPKEGEVVVTKQYASAFFGTSLVASLTSRGVDTVIIAGLTTSGCIRASAVDALQYGFIPVVVRDAVADRDAAPHEANLFDLEGKYADTVSEENALTYLRGLAPAAANQTV